MKKGDGEEGSRRRERTGVWVRVGSSLPQPGSVNVKSKQGYCVRGKKQMLPEFIRVLGY